MDAKLGSFLGLVRISCHPPVCEREKTQTLAETGARVCEGHYAVARAAIDQGVFRPVRYGYLYLDEEPDKE